MVKLKNLNYRAWSGCTVIFQAGLALILVAKAKYFQFQQGKCFETKSNLYLVN